MAPTISDSTEQERLGYIKNTYRCIANCDMCGICQIFHGQQPEIAFKDYIEGVREYAEVAANYR